VERKEKGSKHQSGRAGSRLGTFIEKGIIIPYDKLSPQALQGLIEEFVTRNGTDNGYIQASLEQNIARVMDQLRRNEAVVVYDESNRTANIVPAQNISPKAAG
jgi:uncharacterized protein